MIYLKSEIGYKMWALAVTKGLMPKKLLLKQMKASWNASMAYNKKPFVKKKQYKLNFNTKTIKKYKMSKIEILGLSLK